MAEHRESVRVEMTPLRYPLGSLARKIELRIRFLEQAERIEARKRNNIIAIEQRRIDHRAAGLRVDLANAMYRQSLLAEANENADDELTELIEAQRRDGDRVWRPRHIVSLDAPYYRDRQSGEKYGDAMLGTVL